VFYLISNIKIAKIPTSVLLHHGKHMMALQDLSFNGNGRYREEEKGREIA